MLIRTNEMTGQSDNRALRIRRIPRAVVVALPVSLLAHAAVIWTVSGATWVAATPQQEAPPQTRRVYMTFDRPAPAPTPATEPPKPLALLPRAPIDLPALNTEIEPFVLSRDEPIDLSAALFPGVDTGTLNNETDRPSLPIVAADDAMPDIGFAGLGASNARSVVYVVDASGPMVGTLPIVMNELERSVFSLDPAQKFQVILINENGAGLGYAAAPMSDGLIRALPERTREVIGWCNTVRAAGPSEPLPALERALAMRPDAVFLFSRVSSYIGAYEQNRGQRLEAERAATLRRLDQLNPRSEETGFRPTTIKVVQFHEKDPSGLFRAIAREHGGLTEGADENVAYRFITREDGSFR